MPEYNLPAKAFAAISQGKETAVWVYVEDEQTAGDGFYLTDAEKISLPDSAARMAIMLRENENSDSPLTDEELNIRFGAPQDRE
jgi:hypothetical protein